MITVIVQGGLGNQLFQYAYDKALMAKRKVVQFNTSFFETNTKYTKRYFTLNEFALIKNISISSAPYKQNFLTRVFNRLDVDRKVRYVPLDLSKDNYIADGYYNTEKYFKDIRTEILQDVTLLNESDVYKQWKEKILSTPNGVIVHARRTDYLKTAFVNLDESYYVRARQQFPKDATLFAFSDDIEWLKGVLGENVVAVSGQGLKDFEEMMLMTHGKNFIIANSTFSWWGAWLSVQKNKKVVAPKKFFRSLLWWRSNRDIFPPEWVRV
jgi:predicted phosphatase